MFTICLYILFMPRQVYQQLYHNYQQLYHNYLKAKQPLEPVLFIYYICFLAFVTYATSFCAGTFNVTMCMYPDSYYFSSNAVTTHENNNYSTLLLFSYSRHYMTFAGRDGLRARLMSYISDPQHNQLWFYIQVLSNVYNIIIPTF